MNSPLVATTPTTTTNQSPMDNYVPNASNLKTIGEELDRVSNRLANKSAQQDQHQSSNEFKVPAIPPPTFNNQAGKASAAASSSASSKLPETLPAMDETISSINTTASVVVAEGVRANGKPQKPYQASKQQLNTSGHNHKQKIVSGSLTSTPSKLKG